MEHIQRIFGVWLSPSKTFESFPKQITTVQWLIPLLIVLVFISIRTYISTPYAQEMQLEMLQMNPDIPDDQREEMIESLSSDSIGLIAFIAGIGGATIWYLLQTLIIFGVGTLALGINTTFKPLWAMILLINTTNIIELVVKVPLIVSTGNLMIETGLSLLLPSSLTETFVYNFLYQFDIFSIWRVILIGLGLSIVHNTERTKTYSILFGLWVVYALISAVLMDKFGLFMMRS
ncbi:MAG: YIP1 family protein [Candidatus Marinimicrobia bacterium]|nr:YIP1 family protein [Candidatus Neomarinimicrobiota bacterium]